MRIVSIVGARPQFVKLAPMCRAIEKHNAAAGSTTIEHVIVHTGQHYDPELSDIFFEELSIPRADVNLGVGSGPHGRQTGRMLEQFEAFLLESKPDAVVVYGDTNSTIAGALVASKQRVPVAHVEAGLRSFNRSMPEEINRIATDHVSDLLFAPTATAMTMLAREGLSNRAVLTGDVGRDVVKVYRTVADKRSSILEAFDLQAARYLIVTIHRSENANPDKLLEIVAALGRWADPRYTVVFPIHPRTASLLGERMERLYELPSIMVVRPVGFLDMLRLLGNARMLITDSGGLQKEAFFVNTPCVTLRRETEWVETVEFGANRLAGTEVADVIGAVDYWESRLQSGTLDFSDHVQGAFGDGAAANRMIEILMEYLDSNRR